jgi:DNA-binding transcriptional LysR family regulator
MDDLPLNDLDAFTAMARKRSLRTAARKRGVSAASLSDMLRRRKLVCSYPFSRVG